MKKSIVKTLVAILLCLLVIGGVARALTGQAQAAKGDPMSQVGVKDHCINHAEFYGPTPEKLNKGAVETFYGVRGDGKQVNSQFHGKNIVVMYRACNKEITEVFYEISYSRNKAGIYKAGYLTQWTGFDGARKAV